MHISLKHFHWWWRRSLSLIDWIPLSFFLFEPIGFIPSKRKIIAWIHIIHWSSLVKWFNVFCDLSMYPGLVVATTFLLLFSFKTICCLAWLLNAILFYFRKMLWILPLNKQTWGYLCFVWNLITFWSVIFVFKFHLFFHNVWFQCELQFIFWCFLRHEWTFAIDFINLFLISGGQQCILDIKLSICFFKILIPKCVTLMEGAKFEKRRH